MASERLQLCSNNFKIIKNFAEKMSNTTIKWKKKPISAKHLNRMKNCWKNQNSEYENNFYVGNVISYFTKTLKIESLIKFK